MLKALYIMGDPRDAIFAEPDRERIAELVDVYAPQQRPDVARSNPELLADVEVILSSWGAPVLDEQFLAAAPKLQALFYAAGSIRKFVTDASWDRGVIVCSAYAANAIAVAEYTFAQIIWCLKRGWDYVFKTRREGGWPRGSCPGAYGTTVGIISLGMIGRRVCELLRNLEVDVVAYDPHVRPAAASELGVELCPLEELFARSDVVSCHTPWLTETEGLIAGRHFEAMKPDASFINTARGIVVRENEMIEVLRLRTDICAVLDVTYPEPPADDSPLRTMDNVILTPHIAGVLGPERHRLGQYMREELERYVAGEPLKWRITREQAAIMA